MQKQRNFYQKKNTRPKDEYVFGIRAVMEALEAGKDFEKIFIRKDLNGDLANELKEIIKGTTIPVQKVPVEKLDRITRKNHQGVIGWSSAVQYYDIDQLLPGLYEQGKDPFILVLDGVTDVRNFGAIARSAEGAGVDAIVVPARNSAAITPDAVKTSAGALHNIPVCRVLNLYKVVEGLKNSGLKITAASEKATENYYDRSLSGPVALIMGAEDVGVSNDLLKLCDDQLMIPMKGKIASLNVSVAAGILLYEIVRQRTEKL